MTPGRTETPNRSRWIRAYAQGLMEQPLLGMHYAANLERALTNYRKERQTINQQGVGERERSRSKASSGCATGCRNRAS